ncbi:MAG: hypothetical protein R3E45_08770 [Rhodocyclaceae bacterium]
MMPRKQRPSQQHFIGAVPHQNEPSITLFFLRVFDFHEISYFLLTEKWFISKVIGKPLPRNPTIERNDGRPCRQGQEKTMTYPQQQTRQCAETLRMANHG